MEDRSWEMTHADLTAIDARFLSGTLRFDRAILVPVHHDPTSAQVVLRSVVMPWSEAVGAEIKQRAVLRRVPALADW